MKRKYGIHPVDYALGETEKYYSDLAAKGWELVKRGGIFSSFQKSEPKQMRYRVEVVAPKLLEDGNLPQEQIGVYQDCGWEYVTGCRFIHIFRAPEGSDAPEFYLEPEQQAATLKCLRKDQIESLLFSVLNILVLAFLPMAGGFFTPDRWAAQMYGAWIEESALVIALVLFLIWAVSDRIWNAWRLNRLYKKLKNGIPLDHSPKSRSILPRVIGWATLALILSMVVCNYMYRETYPMPDTTEEPYVLLSELGIRGERITSNKADGGSLVKRNHTFMADYWHCKEFVDVSGNEEWLYQDVYILKDSDRMKRFVEVLMLDSTFARSLDAFTPVEIPGLDQAWIAGNLECIAVKGNTAAIFTHHWNSREEMVASLEKIAQKWNG